MEYVVGDTVWIQEHGINHEGKVQALNVKDVKLKVYYVGTNQFAWYNKKDQDKFLTREPKPVPKKIKKRSRTPSQEPSAQKPEEPKKKKQKQRGAVAKRQAISDERDQAEEHQNHMNDLVEQQAEQVQGNKAALEAQENSLKRALVASAQQGGAKIQELLSKLYSMGYSSVHFDFPERKNFTRSWSTPIINVIPSIPGVNRDFMSSPLCFVCIQMSS